VNKTYTTKYLRRNAKKRVIWNDMERDFMIEIGGWHPVNKKTCS